MNQLLTSWWAVSGLVVFVFLGLSAIVFSNNRKERRKAEEAYTRQDRVRLLFVAIQKELKSYGSVFVFEQTFGNYVGGTDPTPSGCIISIEQHLGAYGLIDFCRAKHGHGVIAMYDRMACAKIHEAVMSSLSSNKRTACKYLNGRQEFSNLEADGVDKVVASLVATLRVYSEVWNDVEERGIRTQLATSLRSAAVDEAGLLRRVNAVFTAKVKA